MPDAPDEIRRLADERRERRDRREFAEADRLRDRIRELGYDVVDSPDGYELREAGAAAGRSGPAASLACSVHWLAEAWPEDVLRGIASFALQHPGVPAQHVVVDTLGVIDSAAPGWAAVDGLVVVPAGGEPG